MISPTDAPKRTSGAPIIRVHDLHIQYPDPQQPVVALKGASFEIMPGERVAIIGRSGSGKSSLLRCLGGLMPPSSGSIELLAGRFTISAQSPAPKRELYAHLGLVFQDYGLVKQLSPLQNVLCGQLHAAKPAGALFSYPAAERERAAHTLAKLGLQDRLHLRSSRLSGGEQQRVGIARLLHQDPEIILLDEPIASLDIHWAEQALNLLKEARQQSATTIVILHDLDMVRRWATRALLIDQGQLIFDGDPTAACATLEALSPTPQPLAQPTSATADAPQPQPQPQLPQGPASRAPFYAAIGIALAALYLWAITGINLDASKIFGSADKAADFIGRLLPPDTSVSATVGASILETIQIALLGTTFSIFTALPLSMMAAHNVAAPWLRWPTRLILNTMRTIPSIIWGLFFVAIVGLGPLPGVLALTFYATGYLGKFYYEGIESIDPKPLISLKTVGASPLQRFRWGVFPQLLPLFTSYTLYMFEYNVRAASILGIVGAGGVGFYLHSYINNFVYTKATTALLMLLALVTLIDTLSGYLRRRLTQ